MTLQRLRNGQYQILKTGAVISATDAHNIINSAEHDCTVILKRKRVRKFYEKIGFANKNILITTK